MSIYNHDVLSVIEALEQIVLDEYMVLQINRSSDVSKIYQLFLETAKYEYRWFGIRSEDEFTVKWNDLRSEMIIPDSLFEDASPSTKITLLTTITQRLKLVTKPDLWTEYVGLYDSIARVIRVYSVDSEDVPNESEWTMYDDQIATTLSHSNIVNVLKGNPWLVVLILISWISNRCVLEALGYLTHDADK